MTPLSAKEFLRLIWPARLLTNESLELRVIERETGMIRRKFLSSVEEFLDEAVKNKGDIYYGVATRFGYSGGKKKDCYRLQCVWVDLDERKLNEDDYDPKPDILVDSGGGVHAYWLLKSPALVRDEEKCAEIEGVNRGLCSRFKGDIAAIDVSRILRVPGFANLKYAPARIVKAYAL